MVRGLIVDPGAYLESKIGQPNIYREVVLVIVIGALGSLGALYLGLEIVNATDSESVRFPVIALVIKPIIGSAFLWAGYSIGLHIFANQFNGRGPIRRVFKLVAWALLPIGFGNLIRSVSMYFVYQNENISTLVTGELEPVNVVLAAGQDDPIHIGATVLLALSVLWSGYLFIFAVQHAKDLSREQARKTVILPIGLHVVFILWGILQSLGIL